MEGTEGEYVEAHLIHTHRHKIPHIRTAPPAKHRRDRKTGLRALCRLRHEEPLLPNRDANTLRSLRPKSAGVYSAQAMIGMRGLVNLGNSTSWRQYLRTTQRLFFFLPFASFFCVGIVGIGALGGVITRARDKFTGQSWHGTRAKGAAVLYIMRAIMSAGPRYITCYCRVIACEQLFGRRPIGAYLAPCTRVSLENKRG